MLPSNFKLFCLAPFARCLTAADEDPVCWRNWELREGDRRKKGHFHSSSLIPSCYWFPFQFCLLRPGSCRLESRIRRSDSQVIDKLLLSAIGHAYGGLVVQNWCVLLWNSRHWRRRNRRRGNSTLFSSIGT